MSVPRKLICLLGVVLIACNTTLALEPVRAGQEAFISRAIFAERRLWLLTDAGTISAIDERAQQLHHVPLPEPAFDLWKQDGRPMVVTGQRRDTRVWTVRRWNDGVWEFANCIRGALSCKGRPRMTIG